ncbi:MAG: dynamin family protein [Rivularia sp. (in: cyanobacteria)]
MKANSSNLYEIYNQRRNELLALAQKQAAIVAELKMDEIQTKGTKQGEVVKGLINRLKTDKLRVLIVGRFSSGKSTFVNALLGEKLLPASPTPTTGVLCNITYATEDNKKVILYPKKGMGLNNDKPFDIPVNELEKYIKIDHFDGSEVTSKYKRMKLLWPLELCANGVELIDSVGLDDPDSRDDITLDYAKSVDAVLYLMKSQDTGSRKDLDTIKLLHSLGYESLFFIITYYDHIKESASMGEQSEEDFEKFVFKNLSPFTELDSQGIKFVDSRTALLGRINQDNQKLVESGIEDVEKALESFLVEQKGRAKILTTLRSLSSVNMAVRKVVPSRIDMLQASNEELEKRYEDAKIPLDILGSKRELIVKKVDSAIADIAREAFDLACIYFQELPDKIPTWTDEYEIEAGIGFPPRKSTLEPVVKEVIDHLKQKIELDVSEWTAEQLSPMVEERVQQMYENLEREAHEFLQAVEKLRFSISIGEQISDEELAKQKEPSIWGRLGAGAYTLMTGDFLTGGMGMVMGFQAMLKTMLLQFLGGIILAIFNLLNPIALIATTITAIIAGGFLNILSLKGGIKKNVSKKLCEELATRKKDFAIAVETNVKNKLMELKNALDEGLAGEISSIQDEVKKILEERKRGKLDIQKEVQKLRKLEKENIELDKTLGSIRFETGL